MGGLFRYDSKPMRFLGVLGDLIVLNLLSVICSLPLFTAGAAASALYTMTFRLKKDGVTGGMIREFLRAFGQNFKKGTLLWLLYAAAGAVLAADWLLLSAGIVAVGTGWKAAAAAVTVLYTVSLSWVFALQARFENSISHTVRNSLLLAVINLPAALCAAVLTAAPWILWYYKTDWCLRFLPLWVLLIFSGIAYLKTIVFEKIFDRYAGAGEAAGDGMPPEEETASAESVHPEEEIPSAETALSEKETPAAETALPEGEKTPGVFMPPEDEKAPDTVMASGKEKMSGAFVPPES